LITKPEHIQTVCDIKINTDNNIDFTNFNARTGMTLVGSNDPLKDVLKYFPKFSSTLSWIHMETIKDIPFLTPGDYRAVWNRFRFRDMELVASEEIISALRTEASFKTESQTKIAGF
jgi:hypothetical protein